MQPAQPQQTQEKKSGFFLKYYDYKALERIIEAYNLDSYGNVNFNDMKADEKDLLWKIKTVIRNMEAVRLRLTEEQRESLRTQEEEE